MMTSSTLEIGSLVPGSHMHTRKKLCRERNVPWQNHIAGREPSQRRPAAHPSGLFSAHQQTWISAQSCPPPPPHSHQPPPLFTHVPSLLGLCSRTRCVRSGVRLLIFHMGTWGFSLGEAERRRLYTR